jgi:hypothetical protein
MHQTTYIHKPDEDTRLPYTAWEFVVTYNAERERGGAPGVHVTDETATQLLAARVWCGKKSSRIELDPDYEAEILAWFAAEMQGDYVAGLVREACAEDFGLLLHCAD